MDRLIETRHVAAAEHRHINVPGGQRDGDNWLFLPQAAGGSIDLPGQEPRQLHWHLQTHSHSILTLSELSLTRGQIGQGLQLQIQDQVFPAVAAQADSRSQRLRLCLVLASKAVAVLTLPLGSGSSQTGSTTGSSSVSFLDRFGQGGGAGDTAGWHVVQCAQQLSAVGLPSAVAVSDGHLCITGSSGSTTCISMSVLASASLQELPADGQQSSAFSLDPSGLVAQVKRRIGWAASSPAVSAVPVDVPAHKHSSLLVVHEDGGCHQWLVGQHRQGSSMPLSPASQGTHIARPLKVCVCYPVPNRRSSHGDVLLVFDLGLSDRGAQSDIRVLPLRLQREQDQSAAASKLEPLLQQPVQLQLERPDASLVDAKVVGQQLLVLCSTTAGSSFVVSYAVKDWTYQGPCQLLQQKAGEWGGPQEVWTAALAAFADHIDPATHVLSQLLVPGQLCGDTLRATLGYFGGQLGPAELASSTFSQLQACITAAVQLIQARHPSYSPGRCWHMLFAKYCELWQQQHTLLGLWASGGGWVGAVRAGGLLTVLRGVTPAEALGQETMPSVLKQVLEAAGLSDRSSNSGIIGGPADVAKLRICLDTVGDVLGQPALRVMTQLVMAGVPVESHLLPAFVQLLLQGPPLQQHAAGEAAAGGFVGDGGSTARQQQQLLDWRQQRQARLLAVHAQLAELPHALETLSGFMDLVIMAATQAAAQLQQPSADAQGGNPPLAMSSLMSNIALHSLRATCLTLQKLLLLLGYISHMGSLGSAPVTAADQAAMAADLITPLATALRSAAAALWLCKTPASGPVPGLLASLRSSSGLPGPLPSLRAGGAQSAAADSGRTGPEAAAGASSLVGTPACWRYPLAAHLLPSFWQQQRLQACAVSGAALGQMADQLSVWLMLGAETSDASDAAGAGVTSPEAWFNITGRARASGQGSGPGVHAKSDKALKSAHGLAGRAVLVGYRLFESREYAAMQQLVRLVGGKSPSEAGLQYILGLSIACSVHGRKAASESRLDAAVGHLFRAAAGLCNSEAGPLRLVLQLLRRQQQQNRQQQSNHGLQFDGANTAMDLDAQMPGANGGSALHGKAASGGDGDAGLLQRQRQQQQEAMLRLQFDQAVMMLFEQKGVKEGALAFARAALSVVEEAYGPQQQEQKVQIQAHLWSSIFNMAFDLGLVEDAYTAALSNPQHDLAEENIRRLVLALLEQGQLQQLLSLPWAGVLSLHRDNLTEPVPVVEIVIDRLVSSACFSHQRGLAVDALSSYNVLYDFVLAWGNHKHAAAAMLAFARRLRSMAAAAALGSSHSDKQQLQHIAQEVESAYGLCLELLQQLEPTDAWIDPTQRLLQQYQAPAPKLSSSRRPATVTGADDSGSPFMQRQRRAAAGSSMQLQTSQQTLQQQQAPRWQQEQQALPAVLSLLDVQHEAAIFAAGAALRQKGSGLEASALMGYTLDVGWLFDQLVGQGLYQESLALAHVAYSGQQLLQQLEVIAAEWASQCADVQRNSQQVGSDFGSGQQGEGFDDSSMFDGRLGRAVGALRSSAVTPIEPHYLGSGAAAAWAKLRQLLEMCDVDNCLSPVDSAPAGENEASTGRGSSGNGITLAGARLRLAAIDGALSAHPRMALPAWLLQPFQPIATSGGMTGAAADPAALLRKLIEHWRLVDATELVLSFMDAWQQQSALQRVHSTAVWLPLQDMELLHASLLDGARRARDKGAAVEAAVLEGCAEGLQEQLKRHVSLVKESWGQLQQSTS